MSGIRTCKTCGVPLQFGRGHNWNGDGTLTQKRDPDHRVILFDSDGLDALFSNIEGLIGIPIEKIVVESKARATRDYISKMLRGARGAIARLVGLGRIITRVVEQGKVMGYGDIEVKEFSWKDNYMYIDIANPYSLPLFCGDIKGAIEAVRKVPGTISYEEIGPDRYLVKMYEAPHAPELEERLMVKTPSGKPGDIEYDKCPGCGTPMEVTHFKWDMDKGTITDPETGLRLALFGPNGLQAIFDELEKELGEEIPAAIVKAQKMHADSGITLSKEQMTPERFRKWLGIHGLGNMVSFDPLDDGLSIRIENPAIPLILTGTAQSLYESFTGTESHLKWEVTGSGDLIINLTGSG